MHKFSTKRYLINRMAAILLTANTASSRQSWTTPDCLLSLQNVLLVYIRN